MRDASTLGWPRASDQTRRMSGTFDGFYTPAPRDVRRGSRWPWIVAVAGVAVITVGGVAFSGGAAHDHRGTGGTQVPLLLHGE
jgi:hypothetical protein